MAIKDVRITARGTQLSVGYNTQLAVWNVDIPVQVDDNYIIAEEAVDYSNNLLVEIVIVPVAIGHIVKVVCVDKDANPVPGIQITSYYRGVDGSNNGRSDMQETGSDGIAYLYLQSGAYNLKLYNASYFTQFINNFQIQSGLVVPYENTGGAIMQSHVLKDNQNKPLPGAFVKVFDITQGLMVANKQTDINGVWAVVTKNLDTAHYIVTFEKPGWDGQKFHIGGGTV